MKIEEATKQMEETIQEIEKSLKQCSLNFQNKLIELKKALELTLTSLRSMQEAGEPLTLDQLREMDGKPVWIERIEAPYDGKWFIVNYADTENPDKTLYTDSGVTYSEYGKYFIAYPYPPAHIDRSKWEACDHCKKACWNCNHNLLCCEGNDKECDDCVNQSKWEFLAYQNYCPKCGRPLTEEAWVELERRVMR